MESKSSIEDVLNVDIESIVEKGIQTRKKLTMRRKRLIFFLIVISIISISAFAWKEGVKHREEIVKRQEEAIKNNAEVEKIYLDVKEITIALRDTYSFTYTIEPSYVSSEKINLKWESSNPDVATITYSGKLISHNPGTTTITATNRWNKVSASCNVTVYALKAYGALSEEERELFDALMEYADSLDAALLRIQEIKRIMIGDRLEFALLVSGLANNSQDYLSWDRATSKIDKLDSTEDYLRGEAQEKYADFHFTVYNIDALNKAIAEYYE